MENKTIKIPKNKLATDEEVLKVIHNSFDKLNKKGIDDGRSIKRDE